jgi:putative flippase GtrA
MLAFVSKYKSIFLFLFSGGTAAVFQLLVYVFLSRTLGLQYVLSSALSFVAALIVSFFLQKFVAFGERTVTRMSRQFTWFVLLAFMNLGANSLLMYTFVDIFHYNDIFSQAFTMVIIAVWSFFFYRHFIFRVIS